jgi:hypothetical protein
MSSSTQNFYHMTVIGSHLQLTVLEVSLGCSTGLLLNWKEASYFIGVGAPVSETSGSDDDNSSEGDLHFTSDVEYSCQSARLTLLGRTDPQI